MAEPNFSPFLSADPTLAGLVGDRIYPLRAPTPDPSQRKEYQPYVTYQLASALEDSTFCGHDGLIAGDYQFDIYAAMPDAIPAIARAIRARLLDYHGPIGECDVVAAAFVNQFDVGVESTPGLHRRTLLITFWYYDT